MSVSEPVIRDERTEAVENTSYRWAYFLLTYALLFDVMYRSFIRHDSAWDLMALVVVSGVLCTVYQAKQKILSQGWVMKLILAAGIAGVIAAILAMTR
jgi:hypothetical protein